MKPDYVSEEWEALFKENGLHQFSDFWNLPPDWVEPCNQRRGGWSGVTPKNLKDSAGRDFRVFIKRQENFFTRTLLNPLVGIPTLEREFRNLIRFRRAGLPIPRLLYFGKQKIGKTVRAILVTGELTGFKPMSLLLKEWFDSPPPLEIRLPIIRGLGELVRKMHQHRLQHNGLFPKHVWIRYDGKSVPEFMFLDLEKARRFLFRFQACRKDLGTLNREVFKWKAGDRILFLKAYLGEKDAKNWRGVWKALENRLKTRHPLALNTTSHSG